MTMQWIVSATGIKALVDDGDVPMWTQVHGWAVSTEPGPAEQVWVQHPDGPRGCIPFEALAEGWAELGWEVGPPPAPQFAPPSLPTSFPPAETTDLAADGVTDKKE